MRRTQKNRKFKSPMLEDIAKTTDLESTKNCLDFDNSIFAFVEVPKTPKNQDSSNFLSPCKIFHSNFVGK